MTNLCNGVVAMKERPILFSGPMVNEILADRKVQTRRIIRCACNSMHNGRLIGDWALSEPPRKWDGEERLWRFRGTNRPEIGDWIESCQTAVDDHVMSPVRCPYGQPGDRLWVRECWTLEDLPGDGERLIWRSDMAASWRSERSDVFYLPSSYQPERWRPSIHMPRWASRINLEVTGVRVERLQDITEADARAEGVFAMPLPPRSKSTPYRASFKALWEEINGPGSWDLNPWVWVVSFARLPS